MRAYRLGLQGLPIFLMPTCAEAADAEAADALYAFGKQMFYRSVIALPADRFAFEVDIPGVNGQSQGLSLVAVWERGDDGIIGEIYVLPSGSPVHLGRAHIKYGGFEDHVRFSDHLSEEELPKARHWFALAGKYLAFGLAALVSQDVEASPIAPDRGANIRRQAAGKPPLLEYRVIKLRAAREAPAIGLGGTHAPPRLHFRRGHFRKLGEKTVPVAPCLVGSKERGLIIKDYEVHA